MTDITDNKETRMKRRTDKATTGITSLLTISGADGIEAASKAILAILSVSGHEAGTIQEALRTLATIGRPPQNVSVSGCTFTASGDGKP